MISIKLAPLCVVALLLSAVNTVFGAEFSPVLYPPSWYKITKVEKSDSNFDISFEFYIKKELKSDGGDYSSEIVLFVQPPSSLKLVKEKTEFAAKVGGSKDDYKDAYYFYDKTSGPASDKGKCPFETWTYAAFGSVKDAVKLAAGIFKHSATGFDAAAGDVSSLSALKYKNILPSTFKTKVPEGTYTWTGTYQRNAVGTANHFSKAAHDWIVAIASKGKSDTLESSTYKGCVGTDATSAKVFFEQVKTDNHKILECGGLYEHDSSIVGGDTIYYDNIVKSITHVGAYGVKNGSLQFDFTLNDKLFPQMKDSTYSTVEITFADVMVSKNKLRSLLKREHLCATVKLQTGVSPVAVSCQYIEESGTLLLKTDDSAPLKAEKPYKLEIDTSKFEEFLPQSLEISLLVRSHAKPKGDYEKPSAIETELTDDKFDWAARRSSNLMAECKKRVIALYNEASERIIRAKAELVLGYGSKKVTIYVKPVPKTEILGTVSSFGKTHMLQLYVPRNAQTSKKLVTVKVTLEKDGVLKQTKSKIRNNLYPSVNFEYPSGFTVAPDGKSLELKFKDDGTSKVSENTGHFVVPIVFDYSGALSDLSASGVLKIELTADEKPVKVESTKLKKGEKEFTLEESKSYVVEDKNIKIEYPHIVTGKAGNIRVYVDFKTVVTKKVSFTVTLDKDVLVATKAKGVLRSGVSGQYPATLKGKNTFEVTLESAALNDYRDKFSFVLEFDASLKSQIEEAKMTIKVNADEVHGPKPFSPNPVGYSNIDSKDMLTPFYFPNTKTKGLVYEKSYKLGDIVKKEKNNWIPCLSKRHQLVEVPISDNATAVYYYTRVVDCLTPWSPPRHTKINKGYRLGSSETLKASTGDLITIGLAHTEDGKYDAAKELLRERKLFRNTLYVLIDKTGLITTNLEFSLAGLCKGGNTAKCGDWYKLMKYFLERYSKSNDDVVFHDVVIANYDETEKTLEIHRDEHDKTDDAYSSYEKYDKIEDFKTAMDSVLHHGYASLKAQDVKGTFSVFVAANATSVAQIKKNTKEYDDTKSVATLKKGDLPHPIWIEVVPIKATLEKTIVQSCKGNTPYATAAVVENAAIAKVAIDDFLSAFFNVPKEKVHSSYKFNEAKAEAAASGLQVPRVDDAQRDLYEIYVNYQPEVDEVCAKGPADTPTGILNRFKRGASKGMKSTLATFKVFAACVHSDDVVTLKKSAYLAYRGITATKFESNEENVLKRLSVDGNAYENATCGPLSLYDNVPLVAKV